MNTTHGTGSRLAELSAFDCWQLLETAEIVRIAWNGPRGVSVVPVNFRKQTGRAAEVTFTVP